ncbi:MAG TPA: DUF2059 domain-containing protein [Longimicrobiaceae bacterium]|nr:DUF2059 domain-containing protein [Longimicrobiaceae bacterium]
MRSLRALVVGCALLFPAGLAAQSTPPARAPIAPSHLAAARELLEVLHLQDVAAAGVQVALEEQIRTNPAMEPYRTVMKEWASSIFSGDEAKNAFATIYAEAFSEADLRALVAFYRTPLGQKLASSQTTLTVRGAEVGRNLATAHQADLMARIQAMQPKP